MRLRLNVLLLGLAAIGLAVYALFLGDADIAKLVAGGIMVVIGRLVEKS